jgi:hypothetical protein
MALGEGCRRRGSEPLRIRLTALPLFVAAATVFDVSIQLLKFPPGRDRLSHRRRFETESGGEDSEEHGFGDRPTQAPWRSDLSGKLQVYWSLEIREGPWHVGCVRWPVVSPSQLFKLLPRFVDGVGDFKDGTARVLPATEIRQRAFHNGRPALLRDGPSLLVFSVVHLTPEEAEQSLDFWSSQSGRAFSLEQTPGGKVQENRRLADCGNPLEQGRRDDAPDEDRKRLTASRTHLVVLFFAGPLIEEGQQRLAARYVLNELSFVLRMQAPLILEKTSRELGELRNRRVRSPPTLDSRDFFIRLLVIRG